MAAPPRSGAGLRLPMAPTEAVATPPEAPAELSALARVTLVTGTSLLVLIAAAFVAGFAGLVGRVKPGLWVAVVAVVVQIAFTALAWWRLGAGRPVVAVAATVLACWVLIVAVGAATQLTSDTSVDGRHYQSETTRAIARGWNPYRDGPLFPSDQPYQPDAAPKANAVVGATILRATDDIDTTRLVGAVLLVAAALVAIAALSRAGARPALAVVGGAVLAANPVALSQLGTAMVDGVVSSLLLAALALTLLWVWRGPLLVVLPALGAALALLVNTKFTGLVYVGMIVLPVLVLSGLLAKQRRRIVGMAAAVLATALLAMVVLGYNPYVTNLLRHEHPLHPIYGPESIDVGAQYRTGDLEDAGEPERVVMAFTGESTPGDHAEAKLPFTFSEDEWAAFRSPSVRIGGFGPGYSGAFLLAFVALIGAAIVWRASKGRAMPYAWTILGIAAVCLASVFVQPSAFLARFAPQLWFVAPLVAIGVVLAVATRVVHVIAWLAIAVLALNAAGVATATAIWDKRDTDREAKSLAVLRRYSPLYANFTSWQRSEGRRLREAGVRFKPVNWVPCPVPYVLSVAGGLTRRRAFPGVPPPAGGVQLCPVEGELPEPPPE